MERADDEKRIAEPGSFAVCNAFLYRCVSCIARGFPFGRMCDTPEASFIAHTPVFFFTVHTAVHFLFRIGQQEDLV
mgnify:CR=1 FL=1